MKPTEFRLNNWVNYHDDNLEPIPHPVQISVSDLILMVNEAEGCCYEPILLTPEILEKAGFNNWDKSKYSNDAICLTSNGDGFLYLANQRHVNLFYIHQLQNLYFVLTGEELNIEL